MHVGRKYPPLEFLAWRRNGTLAIVTLVTIATVLYAVFGWTFLAIPWEPVGILGTAVAFIVGFKNNASYDRLWEARRIYGSVVNDSRSFAFTFRDAVIDADRELVDTVFNRHFAWLTALRFQLRVPKEWENQHRKVIRKYRAAAYDVPEWNAALDEELAAYLSEDEFRYVRGKSNRASQLIAMQSETIAQLRRDGVIDDWQWKDLQEGITKLVDDQGMAERIKNFPYPRNFASIASYLMFVFVALTPFALLGPLASLGDGTVMDGRTVWFNILVSSLVCGVFHTLDSVGEAAVNPFEGSANDVPITQISRMIEIDMREMLDEKDLPEPIVAQNNILM
ncbi:multidrug transporter [Gordonia sp. X0973]|uniref:bestrophin family protein n=1 Tax=Gordonia sp. X0973 TaxID=2742602 RepID=UPI000F5475FD|nr:bestrophin family ion channel [Gordonia sp. X0973]QKT05806.1 multidrug transporter [Gordonia sp. X0973]